MDARDYNKLPDAQRAAIRKLWERSQDGETNYIAFVHRAQHNALMDCVMIQWCGMWMGIETDGYTHS